MKPRKGTNDKVRPVMKHKDKKKQEKASFQYPKCYDGGICGIGGFCNDCPLLNGEMKRGQDE